MSIHFLAALLFVSSSQNFSSFRDFELSHPAEMIQGKPTIELDGVSVFEITAAYTGQKRLLTDESKSFLKAFSKSRGNVPEVETFINAYSDEILVQTKDYKVWLLMQKELMEYFAKEVALNGQSKFTIRYLGHSNTIRMYAVTSFHALSTAQPDPKEVAVQLALVLPKEWEIVQKSGDQNTRVIQLAVLNKDPKALAKYEKSLLYNHYRRVNPDFTARVFSASVESEVKKKKCFTEPVEVGVQSKNEPHLNLPDFFMFLYACQNPTVSGFHAFINVDSQSLSHLSVERSHFPISESEREEYIGWLQKHVLSCVNADEDCLKAAEPMKKAAGPDPLFLISPTFLDTAKKP